MFQLLVQRISKNLSFLALVLLLLINWNVLEYICKLYLFTPKNFLIHNWYRLLLHSQLLTWIVPFAYSFCEWITLLCMKPCSSSWSYALYSSVNIIEPYCTLFQTISRSDCCTGTSKYVIPFLLLWLMHVIIGWSL
jgi:hypothetical protein